MRYEGKIYRPWMESESLLIQVTTGCSNNNCIFCTMFKDKKFRKRKIEVLLSFIFGLGGRERSKEHIVVTTKLLNLMEPEQIAPMALAVQPGSELEAEVQAGEFILPTPAQILDEEKYLLENLGDFDTFYWGDHGNNFVPQKGWLQSSRDTFLSRINQAIEHHPVAKQDELTTFAW